MVSDQEPESGPEEDEPGDPVPSGHHPNAIAEEEKNDDGRRRRPQIELPFHKRKKRETSPAARPVGGVRLDFCPKITTMAVTLSFNPTIMGTPNTAGWTDGNRPETELFVSTAKGGIKAAIWSTLYEDKRSGEEREFKSVVFKNVYREGDDWKEGDSFTAADLLKLREVVEEAISELVPVKVTRNKE